MQITDIIEFIYGREKVNLKELASSINITTDEAYQFVKTFERYKFIEFDEENDIIKLTNLTHKTLIKDHGL